MGQIVKQIGPKFGAEVASSSCSGWPFTWGPASVDWTDGALTHAQVMVLQALVAAHDPTKKPPRVAAGKQLSEALVDLGQMSAWDAALAKARPEDRHFWYGCYRAQVPEDNPKLGRIAALAAVALAAIYDKAVTEPAV